MKNSRRIVLKYLLIFPSLLLVCGHKMKVDTESKITSVAKEFTLFEDPELTKPFGLVAYERGLFTIKIQCGLDLTKKHSQFLYVGNQVIVLDEKINLCASKYSNIPRKAHFESSVRGIKLFFFDWDHQNLNELSIQGHSFILGSLGSEQINPEHQIILAEPTNISDKSIEFVLLTDQRDILSLLQKTHHYSGMSFCRYQDGAIYAKDREIAAGIYFFVIPNGVFEIDITRDDKGRICGDVKRFNKVKVPKFV